MKIFIRHSYRFYKDTSLNDNRSTVTAVTNNDNSNNNIDTTYNDYDTNNDTDYSHNIIYDLRPKIVKRLGY